MLCASPFRAMRSIVPVIALETYTKALPGRGRTAVHGSANTSAEKGVEIAPLGATSTAAWAWLGASQQPLFPSGTVSGGATAAWDCAIR